MHVFVSGADGFVGRHTVQALVEAGHEVTGLVRRQRPPRDGVTYVTGSITDDPPEKLASVMTGCDAVVHLVGIIAEIPGEGQTFERVHVQGTHNILEAARQARAGAARFVYISAVGASPAARAGYSRTKAQAEELVKASRFPYTIFRPSLLLGPKVEFLTQMTALIQKPPLSPFPLPFVPVPGDGQNRFQPVYIADLTRCVVACLTDDRTANRTFEIGGADEVTFDEVLAAIEEHLGVRKSLLHVPMPAMFAAAAVLQKAISHPPITTDQLINLSLDNVCDNSPLRAAFGFAPQTFRETIDLCYA